MNRISPQENRDLLVLDLHWEVQDIAVGDCDRPGAASVLNEIEDGGLREN